MENKSATVDNQIHIRGCCFRFFFFFLYVEWCELKMHPPPVQVPLNMHLVYLKFPSRIVTISLYL